MGDYLLEVNNLKMHFPVHGGICRRQVGKVHAVDGINLYIRPGKTVGLVGESGCGKTTVGRSILRLYVPTEGKVLFDNNDLSLMGKRQLRELRKDMQMVFQDPFESL